MPARSSLAHPVPLRQARLARWLPGLVLASGLVWCLAPGAAQASTTAAEATTDMANDPDWTGKRQGPAEARKEAIAALSQGRRECQRERKPEDRKACVKLVEDDHAAAIKRLQAGTAKR
jgi:hypothetical protein